MNRPFMRQSFYRVCAAVGLAALLFTPRIEAAPTPPPMPRLTPRPPPMIPSANAPIQVTVNGAVVKFDVAPVMAEGTVFVPLRGVFEKMGAQVTYEKGSGMVRAVRKDSTVELKVGSKMSQVNGSTVFMLQPAISMGGRTLVPLRFLGEALGGQVEWNPVRRAVHISTAR